MDIARVDKKITVVIPCYNVPEYLDRCWQSLKNQSIGVEQLECIFINDCSTDEGKTWDKLKSIEDDAPDSVMIIDLEENVGLGEARNIGISHATGKYLQFLDADDELESCACKRLYDLAEENQTDIIQFNHLYVLGEQRRSSESSKENRLYLLNDKKQRIPFLNATIVTYGCTNKFYRLDLIKRAEVKFPRKLKYEEPLFVYPLFMYAERVYLLNEELYIYYFRSGSIVTSQLGTKILDHPSVQLMLLEYIMARKELFSEYHDIVEIYFLWTFYCETINFAGVNNAEISLDFFRNMQSICKSVFSKWRDNPHLSMIPDGGIKILESMYHSFETQEELNRYILEVKDWI